MELARALVADPVLLMADEPSSGLDIHETRELGTVLRQVQRDRGMAMVLVEHDLAMVAAVVDRTVVMNLGEVIAEGAFDEVMADPAVRHAYLGVRSEHRRRVRSRPEDCRDRRRRRPGARDERRQRRLRPVPGAVRRQLRGARRGGSPP